MMSSGRKETLILYCLLFSVISHLFFERLPRSTMAAAMKAKLAQMVTPIQSKEQWDELVAGLNGRLLVLDVHKEWCGPCTVMRPTMERIYIELEKQDERIVFVSIHENSGVDDEGIAEYFAGESCKPRFICMLDGKVVGNIDGALTPALTQCIADNVPEYDD